MKRFLTIAIVYIVMVTGVAKADVGHDVGFQEAEALYDAATGELFFDSGGGIGNMGLGLPGDEVGSFAMYPENVDRDSLFGVPAQNNDWSVAYVSYTGLPVGEDSVGFVLPPGRRQDEMIFVYVPIGHEAVFSPVFMIPVPEPSTIAMLALGVVGLLAYGWRRRRAR